MRCLSWVFVALLWFSAPAESGYYWMMKPDAAPILVYVCQVRKVVLYFDPIKNEVGKTELHKIPTKYKFQGPLEPCVNGNRGDKL